MKEKINDLNKNFKIAEKLAKKSNDKLLNLFSVSQQSGLVCSCGNNLTQKEFYYSTCLKCGDDVGEQTCG